jgi:tetratricopeptide (TPR) repeat protein
VRGALAAAAALALGLAAPPARAADRAEAGKVLEILRLLADEDVAAARAQAEPLLASRPDDPAAKLAAGVLRFYEQRYDDAVALLEGSRSGDAGGYLGLARAAREVTKGHARFESDHFAISHPPGKDEVLVPYLVDALERQRAALADALGASPEGRLAVEIVNDVKELAKLTTLTEAEIRTSGTVAVCKFNKLMVLSPKALLKGYAWLDTAAHEYAHLVITLKSRNRAPIWLQEGLAKWFEDDWRGGGEPLSPFEAAAVRDAAERNALVTFEEMHPSLAKLPSQERAALAYAEVVLAIERLVQQAGPKGPARVLDLVAAGKDAGEAVAQVVGKPFDRFLAEWRQGLATRPLPRGGEHALRKLRFKDDPKHGGTWSEWAEIPDDRARGFARLGEMMRSRGRPLAARIEYAKAWERVGAKVPILADQYALVAMASGAEGLAEKVLAEAIGWSPEYAALHVHLARLLVRREEWAKARDHLLLANRQDPFDPEIHAGLARALGALGDPGGASREERFARILSPEAHR